MKCIRPNKLPTLRLLIVMLCVVAARLHAADEVTAFDLIKEGNKHVGEEAKDKISEIRSEKSIGSLYPTIWYVVYYDRDATFKATEVKFGAGKKLEVKRPTRLFEMAGKNKVLDRDKLRIDSDRAIDIARKEPILDKLTLTASQLKLERWEEMPVWKVRFWAKKLRDPNVDVDIGQVFVSAEDGKVVKNDTRIGRVD